MSRNTSEFEKILSTFLKDSEEFSLNKRHTIPQSNINNAQIFFISADETRKASLLKSPYFKASNTPRSQPKLLSRSDLSPQQQHALRTLELQGLKLDLNFSERDLKAEWRRLAFLLHPDTRDYD